MFTYGRHFMKCELNQDNDEKSRIRLQIFLNKFRTIQEYLLENSKDFVIKEIDLDNVSGLIVFRNLIKDQMHDYILQKIEENYKKGLF